MRLFAWSSSQHISMQLLLSDLRSRPVIRAGKSSGLTRLDGRGYAVVRVDARTDALVGQCWRPDALSAVEHRPADVVPQQLVVEYELTNSLREPVALPPALE